MVHEAYVSVARHFAGFRGGDGLALLLTIIRNSYTTACGQRVPRTGTRLSYEELHSAGKQIPNPETALLLAARSELVKKCLAELPRNSARF
jgi:DNA-directed RNA polymerase specialized sigma24 family protein